MAQEGVVIKSTGSWYVVRTQDGKLIQCRLKGKLRIEDVNSTNPVVVGDHVLFEDSVGNEFNISSVLDRKNYIIRDSPRKRGVRHIIASNIEQAILLVSISKPRTSLGFIDRFLLTSEAYHIPVHIIINKSDLHNDKEILICEKWIDLYSKVGYSIDSISAFNTEDILKVKTILQDKVSLISGHSGVGKSTLINQSADGIVLRTGDISKKHEKGVHTTTFAEMHELPFGGFIIDTPGIKEFGICDFEPHEISQYFKEFIPFIKNCQFNNCLHIKEPGCAVLKAMSSGEINENRYVNYLGIVTDYIQEYKHWEK